LLREYSEYVPALCRCGDGGGAPGGVGGSHFESPLDRALLVPVGVDGGAGGVGGSSRDNELKMLESSIILPRALRAGVVGGPPGGVGGSRRERESGAPRLTSLRRGVGGGPRGGVGGSALDSSLCGLRLGVGGGPREGVGGSDLGREPMPGVMLRCGCAGGSLGLTLRKLGFEAGVGCGVGATGAIGKSDFCLGDEG